MVFAFAVRRRVDPGEERRVLGLITHMSPPAYAIPTGRVLIFSIVSTASAVSPSGVGAGVVREGEADTGSGEGVGEGRVAARLAGSSPLIATSTAATAPAATTAAAATKGQRRGAARPVAANGPRAPRTRAVPAPAAGRPRDSRVGRAPVAANGHRHEPRPGSAGTRRVVRVEDLRGQSRLGRCRAGRRRAARDHPLRLARRAPTHGRDRRAAGGGGGGRGPAPAPPRVRGQVHGCASSKGGSAGAGLREISGRAGRGARTSDRRSSADVPHAMNGRAVPGVVDRDDVRVVQRPRLRQKRSRTSIASNSGHHLRRPSGPAALRAAYSPCAPADQLDP